MHATASDQAGLHAVSVSSAAPVSTIPKGGVELHTPRNIAGMAIGQIREQLLEVVGRGGRRRALTTSKSKIQFLEELGLLSEEQAKEPAKDHALTVESTNVHPINTPALSSPYPDLTQTSNRKTSRTYENTKTKRVARKRTTALTKFATAFAVHIDKPDPLFVTLPLREQGEKIDRHLKAIREAIGRKSGSMPPYAGIVPQQNRKRKHSPHAHLCFFGVPPGSPEAEGLDAYKHSFNSKIGTPSNTIQSMKPDPEKGGLWQFLAGYMVSGNIVTEDDLDTFDRKTRRAINERIERGEQLDVITIEDGLKRYGGRFWVMERATVWEKFTGLDHVDALLRALAEWFLLRTRELVADRTYPGLVDALVTAWKAAQRVYRRMPDHVYCQPHREHVEAWALHLEIGRKTARFVIPRRGREFTFANPFALPESQVDEKPTQPADAIPIIAPRPIPCPIAIIPSQPTACPIPVIEPQTTPTTTSDHEQALTDDDTKPDIDEHDSDLENDTTSAGPQAGITDAEAADHNSTISKTETNQTDSNRQSYKQPPAPDTRPACPPDTYAILVLPAWQLHRRFKDVFDFRPP